MCLIPPLYRTSMCLVPPFSRTMSLSICLVRPLCCTPSHSMCLVPPVRRHISAVSATHVYGNLRVQCSLYYNAPDTIGLTSIAFAKKLGLRLATIYIWCLSNKSLHIQKPTLKSPLMGVVGFIPFLGKIQLNGHKIKGHLFICTLQFILLSCDTICDSAVYHDCSLYLCKQRLRPLWDSFWPLTTSKPIALVAYMWIAYDGSRHLCK